MSDNNEKINEIKEAIALMEENTSEEKIISDHKENPGENKLVETKIVYLPQPMPAQISQEQVCPNEYGKIFYSVFHSVMSIVAVYLSFRCNKGFNLASVIVALFFPYIYIIYTLATKGTCGILEKKIN